MLLSLSIRDFVIVSSLNLEFSTGYTVLTGETGAGKSILIDALSLALGARAETGVTRASCEKADISAIFNIANNAEARDWLSEAELLEDANEVVMRRVMFADGRSRAYINGAAVTVAQQKALGELLIDIYSQNAHHSLLKLSTQRQVLDQFGGLSNLAAEVSSHYKIWYQLHTQQLEAQQNAAQYAEELALLTEKRKDLGEVALSPADWEQLQQDHVKLSNGAGLITGIETCRALLSESDVSALDLLSQITQKLSVLTEFDASLTEVAGMVDSALIQLQEADRTLNRYLQRTELDPASLVALDARIQNIHQTARKYRIQPESIEDALAEADARIEMLTQFADDGALAEKVAQAFTLYTESATQLSAGRQLAAAQLATQISGQMQQLSLSGGKFEVSLTPCSASAHGAEEVEFLVAGHAGVAARPLNKAASGGELSRISLAIRVVTAKKESIPTMIFDEVDVGIGGGVAEVVGKLLKQLGETIFESNAQNNGIQTSARQVLVITHLPQVAALGRHHLRVSKALVDGQTLSSIAPLDAAARVEEIARMLGGVEITETTRQHAKEMLSR